MAAPNLPTLFQFEEQLCTAAAALLQAPYVYTPNLKYLSLPGTSGSYASAPDSAALSITGEIDIRAYVSHSSWRPAGDSAILAKWIGSTNQRSFIFQITGGSYLLQLIQSTDGTALVGYNSTAVVPVFTTPVWLRVTSAPASLEVKFYTSRDGTNWAQLGNTVSRLNTATFDSTSALEIGSANTGSINLAALSLFRAQIYNGIAGTLALDADFNTYANGTTLVESSSNAAVVTLNGSATVAQGSTVPTEWVDGVPAFVPHDTREKPEDRVEVRVELGEATSQWARNGEWNTYSFSLMADIITVRDVAEPLPTRHAALKGQVRAALSSLPVRFNTGNLPYLQILRLRPVSSAVDFDNQSDRAMDITRLQYEGQFAIRQDAWPA